MADLQNLSYTTFQVQQILDNANALNQIIPVSNGALSYADFDGDSNAGWTNGRIKYDNTEHTFIMYNDVEEVSVNVGEELWARLTNDNAFELLNGQAVYVKGAAGANLTVDLLDVTSFDSSVRAIGLLTHDIASGLEGYVVRYGAVREMNTSAWSVGDIVYGDPVNPGGLTNVRPMAPFYPVRVGIVIVSDPIEGVVGVDTLSFNGTDTTNNLDGVLNGIVPFEHSINFLVDTGVIYADVTNANFPTRTLSVIFGNERYELDTLTGSGVGGAARVALIPGINADSPQLNYVYIENSTGTPVLTASVNVPTNNTSTILGTVTVYDVATTLANGDVLAYRRFNNAMYTVDNDGLLIEMLNRLRVEGAKYLSGVDPTISIGDPDGVQLDTGKVFQLHLQNFGGTDGTKYYVVNHPDGVVEFDDFNDIFITSDGTEIASNRNVGYEICGSVNSEGVLDKCLVILPSNSYNANQLTQCIYDYNNYSITSIGQDTGLANIAFRVCRLVLKRDGTGLGGVWENPLIAATGEEFQDRRGQALGASSGGGGGGSTVVTDFDDVDFTIYNDVDNTKIATFGAENIPTGTINDYLFPVTPGTLMVQDSLGQYTPEGGIIYITGDVSIDGTLETRNEVELKVEDKIIQLAVVDTPTDVTANGGGIVLTGATDKTILWDNADDKWHFNQGISVDTASPSNLSINGASQYLTLGEVMDANSRARIWYDGGNTDLRFDTSSTGQKITFGSYNGGTELDFMTILGSGNVGFGTNSPSAKVDIFCGSVDGVKALSFSELSGISTFSFEANFLGTGGVGNFITMRDYNGNNCMTWNGNGNVGIGTDTLSEKLEVNGNILISNNNMLQLKNGAGSRYSTVTPSGFNIYRPIAGGYVSGLRSYSNSETDSSYVAAVYGDVTAGEDVRYYLYGSTDYLNPNLMIDSDTGNVGLGTINAGAKLTIKADSATTQEKLLSFKNSADGERWFFAYDGVTTDLSLNSDQVGDVITANRATGKVTIGGDLTVNGDINGKTIDVDTDDITIIDFAKSLDLKTLNDEVTLMTIPAGRVGTTADGTGNTSILLYVNQHAGTWSGDATVLIYFTPLGGTESSTGPVFTNEQGHFGYAIASLLEPDTTVYAKVTQATTGSTTAKCVVKGQGTY